MRLTYKGDYSIKVVLELSLHYGHGVTTITDLAEAIDAPVKFLEQVLLDLKRGGFLESKRGKHGGYELARPPKQIVLGEVVRYIDGPTEPIACVNQKYKGCKELDSCLLRGIWQQVDQAISGVIDNITFADMANQLKRQRQAPDYSI
jgi:Rrf2 family protein